MALTVRTNGTGGGIVSSDWWNDYYNLLTGTMNDQAVSLNYRPGSATGLASLTLKGDGNTPLLKGYDTDNTTVRATLDHSGNLTVSGNAIAATHKSNPASVPGSTTSYLQAIVGSDSVGRASVGIRSDGSGNLRLGNNGTSYQAELYTDGSQFIASVGLQLTAGSLTLAQSNAGMEIGASGASNTPFIDFHSGATGIDYDTRIIASGGTGTNGQGNLNIIATALTFNGNAILYTTTTGLTGKMTANTTAPGSPATGDLWLDTSTVL